MNLGNCAVIVGAQWGDEGKGRIVHNLAKDFDAVVRYQGGNNAGHTVVENGKTYKLHFVPSGIIYDDKLAMLGPGMVVDPVALLDEMRELEGMGVKNVYERVAVDFRTPMILPIHRNLDKFIEELKAGEKVGTTGRGIGPAYADDVSRVSLKFGDLEYHDRLEEALGRMLTQNRPMLKAMCRKNGKKLGDEIQETMFFLDDAVKASGNVTDVSACINEMLRGGGSVLLEGAQGAMLDVTYGTRPFVTSSHPTAGGACVGAGIGPKRIKSVVGVAKAYLTRVGQGPFPTKMAGDDEKVGEFVRKEGHEYGTTTGRPRDTGWLDVPMLNYAAMINGLDGFIITKVDVLGGLKKIKVCTNYLEKFPRIAYPSDRLDKVTPEYEEAKGWKPFSPTMKKRIKREGYEALPKELKDYLYLISKLTDLPVLAITYGAGAEDFLEIKE